MNNKQVINSNSENTPNERQESVNIIPVIEETATIEKRVVESGKVRISKHAVEVEEVVDVPLLSEKVSVERVPVNQVVAERLPTRYDGDTLIIPVIEEQVVLQKRLVLVEELHIKKQTVESHTSERVTLLKEKVEVTRVAGDENSGVHTNDDVK